MENLDLYSGKSSIEKEGEEKVSFFGMSRFFTRQGKSPFRFNLDGEPINWISEEVKVSDDMGKVIFTQPNVRRPDFWSSLAIKVVASKYFWGDQAKGERATRSAASQFGCPMVA